VTPADPTRTHPPAPADEPTGPHDPALDAGLAAAFGPDPTPGGWSQPPLLRDGPSDHAPVVQPSSPEMPRGPEARYQLLGEIARGGMGVVLKGRDPDLGRDLAFKVLKAELAGRPAAEQRFVEEAQVGGQLQHPGVVPVYDLGRFADGRPFFAMKLVKGRTLAEALAERADPAADRGHFLHVFLQVCQTVAYAHSRGVIHRDLKPANVMVGSFGEVLVMDWGLAKVLPRGGVADEDRATRASRERQRPEPREEPTVIHTARSGSGSDTAAGSVMGTPAYMSPEQAGGEIDKLDERADVYGLGAVLCVVLTGRPPYLAATAEATRLMAIRGELADAFARLDACGADAELVALCKRCLAADRDARPRHAGEVAGAVSAHLAGVEDRARRAELDRAAAAAEAREQRKRRRVQLALAAAVGLLAVGGGAAGWWVDKQAEARRAEERDRRAAAGREVDRAVEEAAAAVDRATRAGRDPGLWAEARTAARQAVDRAAAADVPDEARDRARALAAAAEQGEKNRRLVAALLEIQAEMGDQLEPHGGQDFVRADARYAAAFREYGVDPFAMPPDAAADLLGRLGGDVRVELAAALDDWAYVRPSALAQADPAFRLPDRPRFYRPSAPLARITQLLDPDPVRNRLREAVAGGDADALGRVAARLAEEVDPAAHPAQTVNLVAVFFQWTDRRALEAAVRFLRKAHPHHPGDFQINHNLAFFLIHQGRFADALPPAAAAVAVRPRSAAAWDDYARALAGVGRADEALAAHRRVAALSPRNLSSRLWVIELSTRAGDRDGAAAARAEFDRLPKTAVEAGQVYTRLGYDLRVRGDLGGAAAALAEAVAYFGRAAGVPGQDPTEARLFLQNAHHGRAVVLGRLGRHAEAAADWDRAVELADPRQRNAFRAERAVSYAQAGRAAEAVAEAADLTAAGGWNAPQWYDFACVYGLAADKLPDRRDELAGRAVELLGRAIKAGWRDRNHIDADPDFDAVRGRPDFRKLVESLPNVAPPPRPAKP
jgi:serine/threonine-protein kinase